MCGYRHRSVCLGFRRNGWHMGRAMKKKELLKKIKDFKPQFGNVNHIRALELINKFTKSEELKKRKVGLEKQIHLLEEEIEHEWRGLAYLMES